MKRPILLAALLALPSAAFAQDAVDAKPLKRVNFGTSSTPVAVQEKAKAKPFMGITLGEVKEGGVLIDAVHEHSGANSAGLKVGDRVLRVGEHKTPSVDALMQAVASHEVGDQVAVVVDRKGKEKLFLVSLGTRPVQTRKVMGGVPQILELEKSGNKTPVKLQWSTKAPEGVELEIAEVQDVVEGQAQDAPKKSVQWFVHAADTDEEGAEAEGNHFYFDDGSEEPILIDVTEVEGHGKSWLKVLHPEEGQAGMHINLKDIGVDLGDLAIELENLDLDFDVDLEGILVDALHGKAGHGVHVIELDMESDGEHDHSELHEHLIKSLHEYLPGEAGGITEIQVHVKGPHGEEHETFHFGGQDYASQAKAKAKGEAKAKKAYAKAVKALKANQAQGKSSKASKGACESCGCTCQSGEGQAKSKAGGFLFKSADSESKGGSFLLKGDGPKGKKATGLWVSKPPAPVAPKGKQIKTRLGLVEPAPKAQSGAKQAKQRKKQVEVALRDRERAKAAAERGREQAKQARVRLERSAERHNQRRAKQTPSGSESELAEMRAELRAMRAQLAELRKALRDMRKQMGDR